MSESRIKNTKRNIIFSYIDTAVTLIFGFISRSIIIYTLGEQYLGLSSLYSSILQVLNMAELGFSSAIIYNMYKPIADNDVQQVCALLNYYKKIYRIVAIIIIFVGTSLTPFLPFLIKGEYPTDINIYVLYLIYLANTAASYVFFAYYNALLQALQRMDITKISYSIVNILQNIIQLISLIVFKNYYMFVMCMVLGTVCKNLFVSYRAKKLYPQYFCIGEITNGKKKDILHRVKGLLIGSVSSITYTTFDSIIISGYLGLSNVAIYNNYLLIISAVNSVIMGLRYSMQASIGNSVASETVKKNYDDLQLWQFSFSALGAICTTCMLNLYQPFMEIWMGERMLLPFMDVILLCTWFYSVVVQQAFFLYLGAKGFWWEMRLPYVFSTITNIVLNLLLGKILGITGIVLSTLLASIIFGQVWQCRIVFKNYFGMKVFSYQIRQIKYLLVCVVCCTLAYIINSYIEVDGGILGLVKNLVVCLVISLTVQLIVYARSEVLKSFIDFIKKVINTKG